MSRWPRLPISQWILGCCCVIFGGVGLGYAVLADAETITAPRWPLVVWGGGFLLSGLVVLQFPFNFIVRRYPHLPWGAILMSGVAILGGLALVAISIFDPRDEAFSSGRPVVAGAGVVFFLAGLSVFHHYVRPLPGPSETVTAALPALLLTAFALVAAGVGLGGGPMEGAACLFSAPGALILGGLAFFAWRQVIKKVRERRKS